MGYRAGYSPQHLQLRFTDYLSVKKRLKEAVNQQEIVGDIVVKQLKNDLWHLERELLLETFRPKFRRKLMDLNKQTIVWFKNKYDKETLYKTNVDALMRYIINRCLRDDLTDDKGFQTSTAYGYSQLLQQINKHLVENAVTERDICWNEFLTYFRKRASQEWSQFKKELYTEYNLI